MVTQDMIHKIAEEWLIDLETKLHMATLKSDRLEKRLEKILARVSDVCQREPEIPLTDTSVKKKPNFISRIKLKLANRKVE